MSRIDLKNTTFTIPVKIDSKDRARNLFFTIDFLSKNFDTNIIVTEQDGDYSKKILKDYSSKIKMFFVGKEDRFSRSGHMNYGIRESETDIVITHDCDIIMPVEQYIKGVALIEHGVSDFVIPYNHKTYEIPAIDVGHIFPKYDFDLIKKLNIYDITPIAYNNMPTMGGIAVLNKRRFIELGMYNENFKGWGREDEELVHRILQLNGNIRRVRGDIYHMQHYRHSLGYGDGNNEEYQRIISLSSEQLSLEVNSWVWRKDKN